MIAAPLTPDESLRVELLRHYAVLDTPREAVLDDIVTLAAQICKTPIALITLFDGERQWFKAKVGTELEETPRAISFCGHALNQRKVMVVPDATKDKRFADNPLVTGEPRINFYAGTPLVTPHDVALGTLCVIDHVPRELELGQTRALQVLAGQVMAHLELHRHIRQLMESEERLRIVTNNAQVGLVMVNRERRYIYANETYAEILNLPSAAIVGQRLADVRPGVYEEQIRPRLDQAFAGERVSYELHRENGGAHRNYAVRYEPTKEDGVVTMVVGVITDVSDRRQREIAALRLAAIVEHSDDAIISKDLNGIVTSWNRGAEKIFGYTGKEMVGASITRIIPDNRPNEEPQILAKIRRGESVEHFETLRQTKDGRLINVSVTASPIKDGSGKIIGASKVARDITDRRLAEEALRASEARYRTLFDYAPDGIMIADGKSNYLDANLSMCRMLGYTRQELIGKHASDIVVPCEPQHIEPALCKIKEELTCQREWKFRRKDGTAFDADVLATAMPDGNLMGIIRDITERKRSQVQIAEQAAFLDKARDAIVVRDLDGKILYWNSGAERLYGWKREDALGQKARSLLYTNAKEFEEANRKAISEGEWTGELQQETLERGTITVEARWTLIRDNEGNPKSVLAINTDVTDRKKIEAQFMRAQRMESIGTLAGGVAHDLNNILAPILMSIEVLRAFTEGPQATRILDTIEMSAKRGADIVRQVLSFSRGVEGERVEIQVNHLVADLGNIINDTFPKDIRLRFHVPTATWTILGDPTQIHQILLNLCVNARDAMPHGGSLSVEIENGVLDEHYAAMNIHARPGRYVILSVTDTGTGMAPALMDKIFEPFFTTKELNKGTGLGLSTVAAIVKSHKGFVNVYSEPNKGTTFRVYLPANESDGKWEAKAVEGVNLPRGNGETILVIDDEAAILTITCETLQAFGYKVLEARDGAEAVAVYAEHKNEVAVVLTDMMMPVMSGAATIRALLRINPRVKIVAASGLNSTGLETATSAGVKHFLTKPYTAGTLLQKMRETLQDG